MKRFKLKTILASILVAAFSLSVSAADIWVSPNGKDSNSGTEKKPLLTIRKALEKARELRKENQSAVKNGIQIILAEGTYDLNESIVIGPDDSGTKESPTIIRSAEGAKVVVSGGVQVTGWEQYDGNIYKASLDRDTKLRSLFVNGKRMHMAGTDVPVNGLGDWGTFEIDGDEDWAFGAGSAIDGIKFAASDIQPFSNADDVELVQFNIWTEKILCAREMEQIADTTVIKLQQPYGAIATTMAWAGKINYEKSFVIRNAFELLDSPGEFYFDRHTKTLYYYSDGEDMATAEVIAPTVEGLVEVKGKSTTDRVKNIRLEGIIFSYDHWSLMEVAGSHGLAGIQSLGLAVKYIPGGNWHTTEYNSTDVPPGTIQVENAENIECVRNRFVGISSGTAINLVNDVTDSRVEGNYFQDLLGNAVNVGHPQHYKIGDAISGESAAVQHGDLLLADAGSVINGNDNNRDDATYSYTSSNGDTYVPTYKPGDGAIYLAGIEGLCENNQIANNYLRNVSLDFRQFEGITAFFVANTKIEHNDIEWTPYGAIVCGWWWGNSEIPASTVAKNNSISFNRAGNTHQVLDDGGIIYLLGEQPGTVVEGNYIFNGPRCIYPDDGSAYLTITRNVIGNDSYKWMWLHLWTKRCHDITARENYVKNNLLMDNGTNDIIEETYAFREDEFPEVAQKVIENAGIEDEYKDIIPEEEPERISIHPKGFKERDVFH
ncbi:right-handed parallel beta-helix repeat-containing protein [Mangrovibacterium lignilyticum]|uniref:right-handed parallel beta-helix repeat-containing protein n=1 Tax=Mangrovibacterium lignilyticum TaxID=2668052 RepID=UPI0013D5EB84|nr:right-handed parallel beta-helix repeat-containing protein [Mangrovibacterium lignilyticum]